MHFMFFKLFILMKNKFIDLFPNIQNNFLDPPPLFFNQINYFIALLATLNFPKGDLSSFILIKFTRLSF